MNNFSVSLPYLDIASIFALIACFIAVSFVLYFQLLFKSILYIRLLFEIIGVCDEDINTEINSSDIHFPDTTDEVIGSLNVQRNTTKTRRIQ
jgi:hypothetical protein